MTTIMKTFPPVIMLGMHRSGTSLLSRMLSELGLFVGQDLQDEHESVLFIRSNDWILRQGKATWDHPEHFLSLTADAIRCKDLVERTKSRLSRGSIRRYTGPGLESVFRDRRAFDFPWGWKDPRNTFTLPVWLDVYPDARVIHISRHGVDVAQSLCTRESRLVQQIKTGVKAMTLVWPRDAYGALTNPLRCTSLEGAFSLWESYMRQARRQTSLLGDRAHEVCYEEFLERPAMVLENICQFIGLTVDTDRLQVLVRSVNQLRAYAHRKDTRLREFADARRQRLTVFGY